MIKVKYGTHYKQQKERLKQLPQFMLDFAFAQVKRDAVDLIKNFHDGIMKNNFRLQALAPATVRAKARQGMPMPKSPLYGKGDAMADRAYSNMMRLRKLRFGWQVYPSWAKHHTSDLKLRDLLKIHEYGKKFINKGGTITNIPPRPAFRKAYERLLKDRKKLASEVLKKELSRYINTGKKDYFEKQKEISHADMLRIKND
jgi:hypothetical protein